jgi:hypothetical protein
LELKLNQKEEKTLGKIASLLKTNGEGDDPLLDIMSAHQVSLHLLAQQIAFFSVKQPSVQFKEKYLTSSFQKLSQLISDYEKEIQKCQSSSSKTSKTAMLSNPSSER